MAYLNTNGKNYTLTITTYQFEESLILLIESPHFLPTVGLEKVQLGLIERGFGREDSEEAAILGLVRESWTGTRVR